MSHAAIADMMAKVIPHTKYLAADASVETFNRPGLQTGLFFFLWSYTLLGEQYENNIR